MLKEYLNNFNMYEHSKVKLKLDDKEIPISLVDYDFVITKALNSEVKADITIYNLEINIVSKVEIYCNETKDFSISKNEAREENIELDLTTNEVSTASKIGCISKLSNIPEILPKGTKLKYKDGALKQQNKEQNNKGKKAKKEEFKELVLKNSYIFRHTDNELARLKIILNKENEKEEYVNAFYIENGEIYLTKKDTGEIKTQQGLQVLSELIGFNGEELTLVCLYNGYITPLNKIKYKARGSSKERVYMVISVINKYEHDKGLIQTINLKSGKRLETFLSKQNKEKQGEEYE